MPKIEIQGIECSYRDLRDDEEVLYIELTEDDQYFRRQDIPFSEDEINELLTVDFESRKSKYGKFQAAWVEREEKRMTYGEGVYAMINGSLTYIPASYWGYINYWVLEHGETPEYRESDRIFFLFMEFIYFETDVLAVTRGKGRRQGASSLGFYWMWWICGRNEQKIGGSISYNDAIAKKNFQMMFLQGISAMLPCFARDIGNKSDTAVKWEKIDKEAKQKGIRQKKQGLVSYADFLSNSINSYDGGRVTFLLLDETGKYEKMDINTYWSKVSPTLKIGKRKVGMAYLPTTVNPLEDGGQEFEQFWNEADQNAVDPETGMPYGLNTPHKVIRYFVPATDGYGGCIDKFGNSVVDDPIVPVMGNDGCWITEGARTVILKERKKKKGAQLLEHRRDFPLDLYDMFAFATGVCEFNEEALMAQIEWCEDHPADCFWRQVRFDITYNEQIGKREVSWIPDTKGNCWILEQPDEPNLFYDIGLGIEARNTLMYSAGADTYKNTFAIDGSDGCIVIMKKSHIVKGEEKGLYPVCVFLGRPRLKEMFYYTAFLICLYYGCKINIELDAGDIFWEFFEKWGATKLLEWEPARDPMKSRKMIKPGTESAQPFQLAKQLEVAKVYFDGTNPYGYNGNVHRCRFVPLLKQALVYNHAKRTPYHIMVAFQMALLPMLGSGAPPPVEITRRTGEILRTYKLKLPN